MKLFIAAPDIYARDAVGNHCFAIARAGRRTGHEVELYAKNFDRGGEVAPIDQLFDKIQRSDVLFVSYSIFDPFLDKLLALPGRKVCYFHGVTPPELLREFEPETADLCERSIKQFGQLAKFDLVIANSRFTARSLERYVLSAGIRIIPPVTADMPLFNHASTRASAGTMNPNLLVVGRVVPHKRIEDAIEILAGLSDRQLPATLSVVGSAPNRVYFESLMERIQSLGLEASISFKGLVDESELCRCFDQTWALLSVSKHEGFCVPVLEALHLGIPVFVRSGTAASELGVGAIAEFEDLNRACDLIKSVFKDQARQNAMVYAGRQCASELLFQTHDRTLMNIITGD
jgi:glycosyltransferase involved in cell wall biosynthesis